MKKEQLNDDIPDYVNGASDQEIQELKDAVSANPYLKASWEDFRSPHPQFDDQYMIGYILQNEALMDHIVLNHGGMPNSCPGYEDDSYRNKRHFWHTGILRRLREARE